MGLVLGKRDFYHTGLAVSRSQMQSLLAAAGGLVSGTTYYVDGNSGNDGNDGLSWDFPFKTLAKAFAVSHADIARGSDRWARRNRINIAGDSFTEDLVAFPQKTDVVGMGSKDGFITNILGNHAPVNAAVGTRFINVGFEPVAADLIMDLVASTWGAEFWECLFKANGTLIATGAIRSTACPHVRIAGNEFLGNFSGDVIDIAAGAASGMRIEDNTITGGADNGIVVSGVATIAGNRRGTIARNFIEVADKIIDTRATSVFNVADNKGISGNALGATSYVVDLTFAVNNVFTGNDVSATIPVGSSS